MDDQKDGTIQIRVTYDQASAILTSLAAKIEDLGSDLRNPRRNHTYVTKSREEAQAAFQAIASAFPSRKELNGETEDIQGEDRRSRSLSQHREHCHVPPE